MQSIFSLGGQKLLHTTVKRTVNANEYCLPSWQEFSLPLSDFLREKTNAKSDEHQ